MGACQACGVEIQVKAIDQNTEKRSLIPDNSIDTTVDYVTTDGTYGKAVRRRPSKAKNEDTSVTTIVQSSILSSNLANAEKFYLSTVNKLLFQINKNAAAKGFGTNTVTLLSYFLNLQLRDNVVLAEYIWIGGSGSDLRAKTKTIYSNKPITDVKELPDWNYDGSSTSQAEGKYSEVWLRPAKIIRDPFRGGNCILVLCECLDAKTLAPHETNTRAPANKIFETKEVKAEEPWYGIEQEYTLLEPDGKTPLGWPKQGFLAPQGPYYCSVGNNNAIGRHIVEAHYRACLYSSLDISGINAEVMPSQWEFQVGPCVGIDSGDQLWLARYLLERVAEDFGVRITFVPKPVKGDWNGQGCHTNYSTKTMRTPGIGMNAIVDGIKKLEANHDKHMKLYGEGNEERLLGSHETAKYDQFSYGVANRGASIRIPRQCDRDGYGYLEDRRPAANMDPYNVTSLIAETTLLL